jgi:hypothetical protein
MAPDKLGEFFELVAAQAVALVFVEVVEEHLDNFGRWAAVSGAIETAAAIATAVTRSAVARSAVVTTSAVASAEAIAHRFACLLAFFVAELAVVVGVKLFEHSLAHFLVARSVGRRIIAFRWRLSEGSEGHQAGPNHNQSGKNTSHVRTTLSCW